MDRKSIHSQIETALNGILPPGLVLVCPAEGREMKESLPNELEPFMKEQQGGWFDIYAVDMRDNSIVVWADHAIVQRWEVFDAFTNWLRQAKSGRKAQQPARGD